MFKSCLGISLPAICWSPSSAIARGLHHMHRNVHVIETMLELTLKAGIASWLQYTCSSRSCKACCSCSARITHHCQLITCIEPLYQQLAMSTAGQDSDSIPYLHKLQNSCAFPQFCMHDFVPAAPTLDISISISLSGPFLLVLHQARLCRHRLQSIVQVPALVIKMTCTESSQHKVVRTCLINADRLSRKLPSRPAELT